MNGETELKPEYVHQCRYCAYCVLSTTDKGYWCEERSERIGIVALKRPNRCAAFLLNDDPFTIHSTRHICREKKRRHNCFSTPKKKKDTPMSHPHNHPKPPRESLLDEERRHSRENAESLRRIANALELIADIADKAAHDTPTIRCTPPHIVLHGKPKHSRRHEVQL